MSREKLSFRLNFRALQLRTIDIIPEDALFIADIDQIDWKGPRISMHFSLVRFLNDSGTKKTTSEKPRNSDALNLSPVLK